jgi:hypothetical protein
VLALDTQKVPRSGIIRTFTVVTGHVHHTTELGWDRLQVDSPSHGGPRGHHALPGLGRLFTNWTATVVGRQLTKAFPVDRVPTGHFVRRTATAKEVFLAHGTVALILARLAIMIVEQALVNAHSTVVAMLKVVFAADAAKATVFAVIGVLFGRHPEIASIAMVGTEKNIAVNTVLAVMYIQSQIERDKIRVRCGHVRGTSVSAYAGQSVGIEWNAI